MPISITANANSTRRWTSHKQTVFADPQLELWELEDAQWRKLLSRAALPRRTKRAGAGTIEQLSFRIAVLILLLATASHTIQRKRA